MSVWTLLCARHNTVAETSASSELPLCTTQQTAARRDELAELERTLQGLIDDFQDAFSSQRRHDSAIDSWKKLKKRDEGPAAAGASDPGPRVNVEGELALLRRLMRTLRRWRNGSDQFTERGVDQMKDYMVRTRERLLLHRLERTSKDREDVSLILRERRLDGDVHGEEEIGLSAEVEDLEREMEVLNVRISTLTRRGIELERILETEPSIDRLHRKAEQLRDRVVALVTECTSSSSSDASTPPEPDLSFLSGTLIDPNKIRYHPLINHLFRIAGKNRRMVEALRRGAHQTGTDRHQNGNEKHGTYGSLGQNGSGGKNTGNDTKRAKNYRDKTGNVKTKSGSGESQCGSGEKQSGSGGNKTGSVARRPVKCGERNGSYEPEADGVCSRELWMTSERQRCSMLDAEVLLDQMRRMKRWLGQKELFSAAELRDIETRTTAMESHLRSNTHLNSPSFLHESQFFIEDIDSSPFLALSDDSPLDEGDAIPAPPDAARAKLTVPKSASYTDSVNIANERLI